MAAVRAGALGLGRQGARFAVYSSYTPSWNSAEKGLDSDEEAKHKANVGKRYGVSMNSAETTRKRWTMRKRLTDLKVRLCEVTLFLALSGLVLTIVDVEVCAINGDSGDPTMATASSSLRLCVICLTILLLFFLLAYHYVDINISMVETATIHWRVGLTTQRMGQVLLEILICAICPIPETGTVSWAKLSPIAEETRRTIQIPTNVLISIPMFLRLFLLCRYIVLHSALHQDCATRTIASLNHISVNLAFVMKSELYERPLYMLTVISLSFWCVVSWMLTQCERYTYPSISGIQHFADFLWFQIITFFSIGYGDIQVNTYCGRALAILTAFVGTLFSSTLIALMSRKMMLSRSEKRVNHIVAENKMSNQHKHAAARVLQNTWRTVLRSRSTDKLAQVKLAAAQRALLSSIVAFRKSRWRMRMQSEEEDDFFTATRAFMETEDRLQKVRQRQSQLDTKILNLFENVEALTQTVLCRTSC